MVKTATNNDLAYDPNLIVRIQADIAANDVIGEEANALLIYLIYSSRLLENPGAIVARGASGSGKSLLLYRIAGFFPPESRIEAMRMTEASLFRTPEDYFRHRILISGERKHNQSAATADQTAMIRQLLSEQPTRTLGLSPECPVLGAAINRCCSASARPPASTMRASICRAKSSLQSRCL